MPEKSTTRLKAESLLLQKSSKEVAQELFAGSNWKSFESFYRHVRGWKKQMDDEGSKGVGSEIAKTINTTKSTAFNKLKTELGLHENTFNIPTPVDDSVKLVKLPTGCNNILFFSDLQIPFHDISAITCALKYGQEQNVNTIYLNGDVIDFYAISSYQTEKSKRDLVNEIEMTREFFSILRQVFPNAHIYYKRGNHEIRWERYIFNNAKAFEELQELQFAAMFHLDKHNIHLIEDTTIVSIGNLTAIHAHEVRGVGGVFPARTLFMKTMTSSICGDCHRTSEYTAKSITDRFHTCWTVGCMSVLRPNYSPGAQYNHGFAHIRTQDNGDFSVKNFRILDGKII
ncbi:hypothetical protein UFOVP1605_36 [uncultured Caudovirales phage]|uniref:Calcineurin-like phosphoesterase domain-containing protein n=1 Tax=uncultured Caudovirales phage TaxID=2100421 RepID=A0A6J5STF9_9CAUD|nr:hypothetical protein UFOVP1605_36 [uncultured Caudovirales phage]